MKRARTAVAIAALAALVSAGAAAEQKTRIYQKGVLYGTVLDTAGKPVAGATVALQRQDGKILGWCTTNAQGQYALPVDPKVALNLYSHHKSLLEQCANAVGEAAMIPVRAVGSVVTQPGPTVRSAASSVASGTPAPLVGETIATGLPAQTAGQAAGQTAQAAGGAAAYTALGGTPPPPPPKTNPGKATILISAKGFKDAQLQPTAFWMAAPVESKTTPIGLQAWLETVKIAPTAAKDECAVQPQALSIASATVEPSNVPAGKIVTITAVLSAPPDASRPIRVFAREAGKNTVVELTPGADHKTYTGQMTIDPKAAVGETTISIGALRTDPVEVKLNPKKGDPLPEFCRRLDEMSAKKPYVYDPLTMGAANRQDVKLNVLSAAPSAPPKS